MNKRLGVLTIGEERRADDAVGEPRQVLGSAHVLERGALDALTGAEIAE
jgi:hypothetical protein